MFESKGNISFFLLIELDNKLLERILEVLDSSDEEDNVPSRRVIGGYELDNGQRPWYVNLFSRTVLVPEIKQKNH